MAEKVATVVGADFGVFDTFLKAQETGIPIDILSPNNKPRASDRHLWSGQRTDAEGDRRCHRSDGSRCGQA